MINVQVNKKPTDIDEFKIWLKDELKYDLNEEYKYYYGTVVTQLKNNFENSDYWKCILKELPEMNDKYFLEKGVNLLVPNETPMIDIKSLDSLIIKAYRKNILNNTNFPDEPENGWVTPENWFESINDIIRTTIIVKYLDGVEYILNELENISLKYGFDFNSSFEAKEEGYYAAHTGVIFPCSVPNKNFAPIDKNVNIEIQITTQIQDVIKTLLHTHYEENRKKTIAKDYKWQWDYKSPEFSSNYLGHIIHYVEGMIVEIRDKEKQ